MPYVARKALSIAIGTSFFSWLPRPTYSFAVVGFANTYLLTESEVFTEKSHTEVLPF